MRLRLQERRKRLGHTQQSLADMLGMTKQQVSNLETGSIGLSVGLSMQISKFLNYDIDPTNKIKYMCDNVEAMSFDKVAQIAKSFDVPFDEEFIFKKEV